MKQRMRSVTNIQKITKAMKMVAASKLRVAQAATFESRGIVQPIIKLLGEFPGTSLAFKRQDVIGRALATLIWRCLTL